MARASPSAVPDGASRLALWCSSTISASHAVPSVLAASAHSPSSRFTPTEKLGAPTTAATSASSSSARSPAWVRPVVPTTAAIRRCRAWTAIAAVALGVVKSMYTGAAASAASMSDVVTTPGAISLPTSGASERSSAAAMRTSARPAAAARIALPIRPLGPSTVTAVALVTRPRARGARARRAAARAGRR
jgi:hypothetical protein